MRLEQICCTNVRNLGPDAIALCPRVNLIAGANGSGKTALLEAVYLLATGTSFRSAQMRHLIRHGEEQMAIRGLVRDGDGGRRLLVRRERDGGAHYQMDGRAVSGRSQWASLLPVLCMDSGSTELLCGPPAERRKYLDWGPFHVKPEFLASWQRFRRCLKQRNALLRNGDCDDALLGTWDAGFGDSADIIARHRAAQLESLESHLQNNLGQLGFAGGAVSLRLSRGWDQDSPFAEALAAARPRDLREGTTSIGPQRAELRILCDGRPAAAVLSRGQQKMLVCAMRLAQGQLYFAMRGHHCLYLLDDLVAELDAEAVAAVGRLLVGSGAQLLLTAVAAADMRALLQDDTEHFLFHVKQGEVCPAPGGESRSGL